VRSWPRRIDNLDWQKANMLLAEMEAEGQALLETSGVPNGQISHRREADIRYVGQGHEVRVPLPSDLLASSCISTITASFEEVYRRLYERLSPSVPIEIISWRVISSGPKPEVRLQLPPAGEDEPRPYSALKGRREAYLPEVGGYSPLPVYDRYRLFPGESFSGPAIVEERESTIIVGPDSHFRIDEQRNLIIELPSTTGRGQAGRGQASPLHFSE
jgi:N-methylhydantoinase A